jgi:PTS system nitrogen regulatory IIA component
MSLRSFLRPELIFPGLEVIDREEVLRTLSEKMEAAGAVPDADRLYLELEKREQLGSTGIGGGVAIPHCKLEKLREVVVAVATSQEGVDFDAADEAPVRLFFVVVSPQSGANDHLKALAAISRWVKEPDHVERLLEASTADEVLELLDEEEAQ